MREGSSGEAVLRQLGTRKDQRVSYGETEPRGRGGGGGVVRKGSTLPAELWGEDCPGVRALMATGESRLRAWPPGEAPLGMHSQD